MDIAKNNGADVVSESDVEEAVNHLIHSPKTRGFKYIGTIGNIVFGASLSVLLTLFVVPSDPGDYHVAIIFLVIFGIIGAFMTVLHIAKGS